ncbi:MAG: alpha/beta hydrolase, partial [Actinobacteria bacterium]|nr:alpha/beta hydrolase [Actinomycetota bacterium]MCA1720809.1 alpha/beta hydrolase [Actinomycetota bacterium]
LDAGSGPVVVLLHALQANATANWLDPGVASALVDAGYRVVAPDARGHGGSDLSATGEYAPEVLADDVQALVRELALEPVSLVGYSYGSRTAAILAAARNLRVRSVVLGGVAISSMLPFAAGPELDALIFSLEADADPDDPGRQMMAAWGVRPAAVVGFLRGLVTSEPVPLRQIDVPVLVLRSDGEPDDVAVEVPGARSVLVPGDHVTAPLHPEFRDAVLAFLAETNAP